jgi:nicotinate phosphoribosyltransferase
VKVGDQAAKVTTPGLLQVRRYLGDDGLEGDMIYDTESPPEGTATIVDPADSTRRKRFEDDVEYEELLVPVFRDGELCYEVPPLAAVQKRTMREMERLDPTVRRLVNPHGYPVGLEKGLHDVKTQLILQAKGYSEGE